MEGRGGRDNAQGEGNEEKGGEGCTIRNLHGNKARERKERAQGSERERRKGEMKESYVLDEGGCLFYFW